MFNTITNVKNRNVIGNISLEELVYDLKNPSKVHKIAVDKARSLEKGSKNYDAIKKTLPCFVPNYTHNNYIKTDTIEKSTGFTYIDVDYELDIDFKDFTFIAASWKSLSGIGSGILVALDNYEELDTDLKTMRAIINSICEELDIKPDNCAVSRDRLNVIGYDLNTYYNPQFTRFNTSYSNTNEDKKVTLNENKKLSNRLLTECDFYDGDLRLSNYESKVENIVFKDDEVFLDYSDNPINFTQVYISKSIPVGERNSKVYKILSSVKALNPKLKPERLIGFANFINNNKCFEPMDAQEIDNICARINASTIPLFPNKMRKYIFNPIYTLTGVERRSLASSEYNKKRGNETKKRIFKLVKDWDFEKNGKFTFKSLAIKANLHYNTILKLKKEIENLRK